MVSAGTGTLWSLAGTGDKKRTGLKTFNRSHLEKNLFYS
jgi:hypothetical protein